MSRKKEITLDWSVEAPYYMRRFCFTAADLAANRAGKKSPGQKTRIRREATLHMVLIAVIAAVLYLAFPAGPNPDDNGDSALIAAFGGALVLLAGVLAFRAETRAVSCIEGRSELQFTFSVAGCRYLSVKDKLLKLPKDVKFIPFPHDVVFCVYYDEDTNRLLSMEPLAERNRIAGPPVHRKGPR